MISPPLRTQLTDDDAASGIAPQWVRHFLEVSKKADASLAWKSEWQKGITYAVNDLVSYGGTLYAALSVNANQQPGTDDHVWDLVTSGGGGGSLPAGGTTGQVLTKHSSAPGDAIWAAGTPGPTGPAGPTGATGPAGSTGPAGPGVATGGSAGQVLTKVSSTDYDTTWSSPSPGGVTSIGLSMPAEFSVSGSPVTGSGTITVTRINEPANTVFAGPTSGGSAGPTFRSLVAADIPNIAESQVTSLVSDLALKAPLASPALTGTPTAPTAAPGTNTTQIATTAFVEQELGPSGTGAYFAWGGDGTDGSVTFDGSSTVLGMAPSSSTYTLTRDIFCTSITVNNGVTIKTANYAIFATGTITINGTIHNDGQDANPGGTATTSAGASGGSGGIRSSSPTGNDGHYARLIINVAGTAGGNGGTTVGTQAGGANAGNGVLSALPVDSNGSNGVTGSSGGKGGTGTSGAGGAVRAGGTAGTAYSSPTNMQPARMAAVAVPGIAFILTGSPSITPRVVWASNAANGGAAGGSGGGGDGTNSGGGGGGGGGEGGSGGVVGIFAHTITIGATGIVRANGGKGGNGGNGRTPTVGNCGGGGGGGGGSGGVGGLVWLVYHRLTNSGTVQANGGAGGTGGAKGLPSGTGTDDATAGANGSTGPAGNVVFIPC